MFIFKEWKTLNGHCKKDEQGHDWDLFPIFFSCLSMILWYFNFSFACYKNYFSIPDPTPILTDFTGM